MSHNHGGQYERLLNYSPPEIEAYRSRLERSLPLPIPPFTDYGILPLGTHHCDLNEIEQVFVYNEQRRVVWRGFLKFLDLLKPISELNILYIDGGFITNNSDPKDVDVVVEYPDVAILTRLTTTHRFLRDRTYVKDLYKVDLLTCLPQLPAGFNDLRKFFQYIRPEDALSRGLPQGSQKGILRITIR